MKTILYLVFAFAAASGSGFGQSISVSMTSGSTTLCTFTSSSLLDGISVSSGKLNKNPLTLVKTLDACSRTLLVDLFSRVAIPTVTITLTEQIAGVTKPVMAITLTQATVTSVADTEWAQSGNPSQETLQLTAVTMKIADLIDNTTINCSYATYTCN